MNTKLLLIAVTVGLAMCGCQQKKDDSTARQIEQITQQISLLNQKIDTLATNLARAEASINFEVKANTSDIAQKTTDLLAKFAGAQAVESKRNAARSLDETEKLNTISTTLATIGDFESKQGTFIKACHDAESEKLGLIFDNTLEIHKSISDLRSDYLFPIKMKLNDN